MSKNINFIDMSAKYFYFHLLYFIGSNLMKTKVLIKFYLIIFFIGLSGSHIRFAVSNPAPVQLVYYAGGFIPDEEINITLLEASVLIDANTSNFNALGEMKFNGNYTIFNHDSSANITIAAPFHFYPTNNCIITANGSITPYILYDQWEDEADIWDEYLVNRTEVPIKYNHFWLLCNIYIPENHSLEISYKFSTPSGIYYPKWGYYYIIYDVGTSRIWNGNITENIVINIHGNFPDTVYNEEICTIQDCYDGKSYTWNWDNERIDIDYVGVSFYFGSNPSNPYLFITYLQILSLLFAGIVAVPILIIGIRSITKKRIK